MQLNKVVEWQKNPRILTKRMASSLRKCIEKFGFIDKPILNKDFTLIGGHQRIRILREKGIQEIECYVADAQLSVSDAEELALSLNKKTADWDWDKLANEFDLESLLASGFEAKDFVGKGEKSSKPCISFDFDTQDELEEAVEKVLSFSIDLKGCKVRVKNGG